MVSSTNSPFDSALAKCRKVVGHFKHSPATIQTPSEERVPCTGSVDAMEKYSVIKRVQWKAESLRDALALDTANVALLTATELEKLKKLEPVLEHCR